jgi:hypothetical protein
MLVPGLFGDARSYWGPHPFRTSSDYAGLVPLGLAVAGAALRWRPALRWIVLAGASLLLACGNAGPLGDVLGHLPVLAGFRASIRWLAFLHLAIAVLAVHGFEALVAGRARAAWALAGGCLALAVLCAAMSLSSSPVTDAVLGLSFVRDRLNRLAVSFGVIEGGVADAMIAAALTAAAAAAAFAFFAASRVPVRARAFFLWGVIAADLLAASRGFVRFGSSAFQEVPDRVSSMLLARRAAGGPGDGVFRAITNDRYFQVMPNIRMRHGLQWVHGLHGLPLQHYVRLYETWAQVPAVLDVLDVRYQVFADRGAISAAAGAPRRAFFASEVVPCRDQDEALAIVRGKGWRPTRVPDVGRAPSALANRTLSTAGRIDLAWGRDEMEAAVVEREPGYVVFSEVWFPAWKAFVDGVRVGIRRAYGALRGVEVPAGSHRVRMIYDSWTFKAGLWISMAAVAALALMGAFLKY